MHHASMLLNDHSWYKLDDAWDYLRAALWCFSNLVTGISYFVIPFEMLSWKKALPLQSVKLFTWLYFSFIVFCGTSHIAMIFIMPTGPWWSIGIYFGMACVSFMTWLTIRMYRVSIGIVLEAIMRLYKDAGNG